MGGGGGWWQERGRGWGGRGGGVVGRRLTARFMEGGELGVVGNRMMAGPSSVKGAGYIVIEPFGNTYKYRVRVCRCG